MRFIAFGNIRNAIYLFIWQFMRPQTKILACGITLRAQIYYASIKKASLLDLSHLAFIYTDIWRKNIENVFLNPPEAI